MFPSGDGEADGSEIEQLYEEAERTGVQRPPSVWPLIATMDYLLTDLRRISPMTAHLLRMARQNLVDEHLQRIASDPDSRSGDPDELG